MYIIIFVCYRTIPLDKAQCENENCNTDEQFGMHENYDYYGQCRLRQRNKGLFTADQVYHFPCVSLSIQHKALL